MATSGTTSFDLDVLTLLEEAFERAGRQFRSGFDYESARRSLNLLFLEWANQGINLWTIDEGSIPLVAGTARYTLPADTVDLLDVAVQIQTLPSTTQYDYALTRIGVGSWAKLTIKTQSSRPQQFYVERIVPPRITLWPVPDQAYTLKYWRLRRMQDAGAAGNTLDAPFRFLPAMAAGLALKVAAKNPNLDPGRIQQLTTDYQTALQDAKGEDRGRESFWVRPMVRRIR